ncbi:tRNA (guanine(10)-N(2))-dimethyltransferase [Halobacteriales archaeon QS_4_69_34]|nr:MAG: tRNA (guanine(10)-N(2))-dimethyltransferase [Halobacteriales archaeon QS_4_69_34]
MRVREGGIEIEVPEQPDAGVGDAVFFNPAQELNRDLTVAVLRAHRERDRRSDGREHGRSDGRESRRSRTYLDATAATGIRGVRAASEGWEVTCCDRDPEAVALCRRNLDRNEVAGAVEHRDANALMSESRFGVVDLDPFGTPIPFADAAVRSARGLLCVTATDTAPLCGAHFASGVRKYGAVPRNTEYHAEMGLRVLLSALVRTAARHDVAARPALSHATSHYVRTYLALTRRASDADDALRELGYLHHCPACLHREHERGLIAHPPAACPNCGEGVQTAGPIWLGATCDRGFVAAVRERVTDELGTAERARALLDRLGGELDTPTHYDQHRLCKLWGRSASAMDEFLGRLREAGFPASRTHYGGTTFKTTAGVAAIAAATESDEP